MGLTELPSRCGTGTGNPNHPPLCMRTPTPRCSHSRGTRAGIACSLVQRHSILSNKVVDAREDASLLVKKQEIGFALVEPCANKIVVDEINM